MLRTQPEQSGKLEEIKVFKIGDFSKLSQVSIKTLRYYDELGLLKPAHIDRFTNYRYYTANQLARLNRIRALKDLGFPLEQIARLLKDQVSPAQIRHMLQARHTELQQHIQAEQSRLRRVESYLHQIEEEHIMPAYDVVLKHIEPQTVVAVRRVIPTYQHIGELFRDLFTQLGTVQPIGPAIAMYHDPEYREQDVDVEVVVPVVAAAARGSGLVVHETPTVETMACVIHQGPYDTFSQTYGQLTGWIEANNYRIVGPNREVYLTGPGEGVDPATYVTEVQFPVEQMK